MAYHMLLNSLSASKMGVDAVAPSPPLPYKKKKIFIDFVERKERREKEGERTTNDERE